MKEGVDVAKEDGVQLAPAYVTDRQGSLIKNNKNLDVWAMCVCVAQNSCQPCTGDDTGGP